MSTTAGPFSSTKVNDLYVYSVYRSLLLDGGVPYRDFVFEYPPVALLPIGLAGGDAAGMSWLMLACALLAQGAAWALGGARAGWAMVALPPVAGALVATHIDLLPIALTLAGLALVLRERPVAGLAVLGVATMAKLWPAVVAVCALAWLRDRTRPALAFAAVVLALGVPFAAAGGFPREMVAFHLERPVQIESTPAAVLSVTGGAHVTGDPVRHDRFKSNGLDGGPADAVGWLFTLALAAALAWCVAMAPRDLLRASFAATLAFVALGKVLSPQYVCWLLPFAAVVWGARGDRLAPALVVAASLLTQAWFPDRYFDVVFREDWAVAAVAVRDLLLVLALAATARALARSPSPSAAPART
ncbi:MAG: DUF2029 domain-containing protein [Solirubrobacterales bacterium]|nr:DUF2029 domain-containing protein [Solirubrobacterales bacterium]